MIILGIETSCDETAASVARGRGQRLEILSNIISSQIEIHQKYGGVVPEVAAREHVLNMLPVVNEAITQAGIKKATEIDAIAVTTGPGLVTSLLVGVETAKTLAYAWNIPVIAVNHIEAHLYANFIGREKIEFPALILTVSGGHTILVLMSGHGKYKIIGDTRDDAAGEAFDKAANLLGLGYPGGPAIAAEAAKFFKKSKISLPRPMLESKNFDFSFSGLKTALLYQLTKDKLWKKRISEYASEFQLAVVETLVGKTVRAANKFQIKTVMLSGGVAANLTLRNELKKEAKKLGLNFLQPEFKYTTDNAAMIAAAGFFKAKRGEYTNWKKLAVNLNWELA